METQVIAKFKIRKPAYEVFEAIVDPTKIGNFWFSSSSERWEQGKTVTLRYDEYQAEGLIHIVEIVKNEKIAYWWGEDHERTSVTIQLKELEDKQTLIQVTESGFNEDDPEIVTKMMGQNGGWVYMLSCLKAYLEYGVHDLRASLVH